MTATEPERSTEGRRPSLISVLKRLDTELARIEEFVAEFILVALAVVVFFYVVARTYFTNFFSVSWANELGSLLLLWLILLGASIAERENLHLKVDLLVNILPPSTHKVLNLIGALLGAIFLVILIWQAVPLVRRDLNNSMLALPLPLAVVQLAVLVGAALMLFHLIMRQILHVTVEPTEPVKEDWP